MKAYADTTLNHMTKADLIEIIRLMELDIKGLAEINDNQLRLLKELTGGKNESNQH